MNKKTRRMDNILEILKESGSAEITGLAHMMRVTSMTVRRDLAELARNGLVRVYHGVAVPVRSPDTYTHDYLLSQAESQNVEEKTRIARHAASLVEAGDILIMDAGSTTALTAGFIPKDLPIKIICFSLNVFLRSLGRKNSDVILAGGLYHETSRVFESTESIELIKRYRANKAFISASGIREDLGVTCSNPFEIAIKQAALQSSLQKILISDASKFGKITSCFFAGLEEFNMVITDSGISQASLEWMRRRSIKVEVV